MKYRHYSPRARVVIVSGPGEPDETATAGYIGIDPVGKGRSFRISKICRNTKNYAHDLYDFFRRCDEAGVTIVYCQSVAPRGIGLAVMDRIRRASREE